MKKITILFILCVFALAGFGENKPNSEAEAPASATTSILSGIVVDKVSGEKLAGVAVRLEGTKTIRYTDFNGKFKFEGVQAGNYKLEIEFISYNNLKTDKIEVNPNELHELNIPLVQSK